MLLFAVACRRVPPPAATGGWTKGPYIASEPPGADIVLDGQPTGRRTPAQIETWDPLVGHSLRIESPGRVPFRELIEPGAPPARVDARLAIAANLEVETEPPGALLHLGGNIEGATPVTLPIAADVPVSYRISLDGYLDSSGTARAAAGATLVQHLVLTRAATAYFESDPLDALLVVDGKPAGHTPEQLPVEAGIEHVVRMALPGLSPCQQRFRLAWKESRRVACDLDDAEGRRLGIVLAGTRERIAQLKRRLAAMPLHEQYFLANVANDRERNRIEDALERLADDEDREQADIDAHRADLESRFEARGDGGAESGTGP